MPRLLLAILALVVLYVVPGAVAQDPTALPRFEIDDLQFEGAFRLPAGDFGGSSMNYSEGPFVFDAASQSILIVGHGHHQMVAEFGVPALVASDSLSDLNIAETPLQPFAAVLDRTPDSNPQALDRLGGLALISSSAGRQLVINAYEYYDAPADNDLTTLIVAQPGALSSSDVSGFVKFEGGAGHTSGWISEIPGEWQNLLGGSHLTGQSSGIPIISRTSVGPSAFAFDPADLFGAAMGGEIPTETLLDFSLSNPLHDDLSNANLSNDIWTHLSRAVYGFIVPGTRSYLTIGHSGGHASGVCYKCTQTNGNTCGGYCAPDHTDYDYYYWLWDVNDLLAVREGSAVPHDIRPYAYGVLPTRFTDGSRSLGGASFDPDAGLLYVSIQRADRGQGTYSNPPVIEVWRVGATTVGIADASDAHNPASAQIRIETYPNPATSRATVKVEDNREHSLRANTLRLALFDLLGREMLLVHDGSQPLENRLEVSVDLTGFSAGLYLMRATTARGNVTTPVVIL